MNNYIHALQLPNGLTRPLDAIEEAAYYCEHIWREGCASQELEPNLPSSDNYPTWRRADDTLWDLVRGSSSHYRYAVEWAELNYDNIIPAYRLTSPMPQQTVAP